MSVVCSQLIILYEHLITPKSAFITLRTCFVRVAVLPNCKSGVIITFIQVEVASAKLYGVLRLQDQCSNRVTESHVRYDESRHAS